MVGITMMREEERRKQLQGNQSTRIPPSNALCFNRLYSISGVGETA